MQNSDEQRIVLDRLLSELARRLDGAVDFWPAVCLMHGHGFLQKNCDIVRSLVIVTKAIWCAPTSTQESAELLDAMTADCQSLQNAFLTLERFQTETRESIHTATQDLAAVYTRLRDSIGRLADSIDLPVTYWKDRSPEREDYYRKILRVLFDTFLQQRDSNQPVGSSSGN